MLRRWVAPPPSHGIPPVVLEVCICMHMYVNVYVLRIYAYVTVVTTQLRSPT